MLTAEDNVQIARYNRWYLKTFKRVGWGWDWPTLYACHPGVCNSVRRLQAMAAPLRVKIEEDRMDQVQKLYDRLTEAAQAHGQVENIETETGDLQVFLHAALSLLTHEQIVKFRENTEVVETLAVAEDALEVVTTAETEEAAEEADEPSQDLSSSWSAYHSRG